MRRHNGGIAKGSAGEAGNGDQARDAFTGESVGHKAAVGVPESEDALYGDVRGGLFEQSGKVLHVIDLGVVEVAAEVRGVPEAMAIGVARAVGHNEGEASVVHVALRGRNSGRAGPNGW